TPPIPTPLTTTKTNITNTTKTTNTPLPPPLTPPPAPLPIPTILLLTWFLGTLLTFAPLVAALLWTHRLRHAAHPLTTPEWSQLLHTTRTQLHLSRPIPLLLSPRITTPLTLGLLRPCILLPEDAPTWPPEKRRLVLLHELAHIQRRDLLSLTLASLARALHWPNPLAWLAFHAMTLDRERACDDLVISATRDPHHYAEILIAIARKSPAQTQIPLPGGLPMARISTLETRIRSLLNPTRNRTPLRPATTAATLLAALILTLPLAMLRTTTADTAPAAAPSPASSAGPFTQKLPDGPTVELLAICQRPESGPWWSPDGSPTVPPITTNFPGTGSGNHFLLKFTGLPPDAPTPVADINGARDITELSSLTPAQKIQYFLLTQPPENTSLRIACGQGPWNKEIETTWNASAKSASGQIAIGEPASSENPPPLVDSPTGLPGMPAGAGEPQLPRVDVTVASTFDPRQIEWRLLAVDADGKEYPAASIIKRGFLPPLRQFTVSWSALPLDKIKSLRVETRPLHWIEFTNFVTNPAGNPPADGDIVKRLRERRASENAPAPAAPSATPAPSESVVYLLGDVNRPGGYSLNPTNHTLLQAIATAGMSKSDTSTITVTLLRRKGNESHRIIRVTLADLLRGNNDNFDLHPGDIITVAGESDRITALRTRIQSLQEQLDMTSATKSPEDQSVQTLQAQIKRLQMQLEDLRNQE
ncbi:MAG: M56 family metallopeptidase, partial [Phycisphaerae bacterium]